MKLFCSCEKTHAALKKSSDPGVAKPLFKNLSGHLFILFLITMMPGIPVIAQNALMSNRLLVTDHVQIVEKDYPDNHYRYQGIDNLINKNRGRKDIVEIILEASSSGLVQPFSFDEFFDPDFPNNYQDSHKIISLNTDSLSDQIKSIVFIEEWNFDTISFSFSKEVKGFIPIRHTKQELEPELQKLELTALFRQPEEFTRREKRRINRRLVPVKEIAYEFVLTEPHLLYIKDADESILKELGHAAFKYYNINWNRHASNTIINTIIDKSFREDQSVYNLNGSAAYSFDSLPFIVDPYLDEMMENIMSDYERSRLMPSLSEIKYDLKKNVYSIIFFEEWYIDPETLFIEKRVNEIAPVLWQRRRGAGGYPIDDPETGYPVYFKSILFRIPLNEGY